MAIYWWQLNEDGKKFKQTPIEILASSNDISTGLPQHPC